MNEQSLNAWFVVLLSIMKLLKLQGKLTRRLNKTDQPRRKHVDTIEEWRTERSNNITERSRNIDVQGQRTIELELLQCKCEIYDLVFFN